MLVESPFPVEALCELVEATETRDPRRGPALSFEYVDIASICNRRFQVTKPKKIAANEAPSRARKLIRENDVIFATTRPYLKSIAMVPSYLNEQICSTGFCVLRAGPRVLPEWIYYCVTSDDFGRQVTPLMRGANYPAVTDKDVRSAKIPLPPIDEQRRIVSRINECLSRVEEINSLNESVHSESQSLTQALRYDLWQTVTQSYRCCELRDVALTVNNGLYKPKKYYGAGALFIRMFNIVDGQMSFDKEARVLATDDELKQYSLQAGDIVVSRVNSRELVGKSAVVPSLAEPAVFEAMIMRLRADTKKTIPSFLAAIMNAPQFLHNLRQRAKHAIGQSSINQDDLLSSLIPVPSMQQQSRLVEMYSAFQQAAHAVHEEGVDQAVKSACESILRKAFAGEL